MDDSDHNCEINYPSFSHLSNNCNLKKNEIWSHRLMKRPRIPLQTFINACSEDDQNALSCNSLSSFSDASGSNNKRKIVSVSPSSSPMWKQLPNYYTCYWQIKWWRRLFSNPVLLYVCLCVFYFYLFVCLFAFVADVLCFNHELCPVSDQMCK